PGGRRAVTRLGRSRAIPDHTARDAALDEKHTPLRGSLEIERFRQAVRVEGIVGDRDLLVDDALADPAAQVAALLEQAERTERIVREVVEQIREGVRLEDSAVDARLELLRTLGAGCLLRRVACDCSRVDVGGAPGG